MEGSEALEPEERESRPFPCTQCGSTKGYIRVGLYRAQCKGCNTLLRNSEINLEDLPRPQEP